jgi:hypothetical protein
MGINQMWKHENVFLRVLMLYGFYTLLSNSAFLIGYYFLPEGLVRGSPQAAAGRFAATGTFWSELALTLMFNLSVVAYCVLANLFKKFSFPLGNALPISLGISSGLIAGTNSFTSSDLKEINAYDGAALSIGIGGIEMLAYILVVASTVGFGVYQYNRWWQWKAAKSMNLSDIRLSPSEIICFAGGIILLIIAACKETAMPNELITAAVRIIQNIA